MGVQNKHEITETLAWADKTHAKAFDYMCKVPKSFIKKHYECFNDGRFLSMFKNEIKGNRFYEIGCATGELYRYISNYIKQFEYTGFDISKPAIERAKMKYSSANFHQIAPGFDEINQNFERPDVVWCRDVVLHQEAPYEFLDNLIELSKEIVIVRLRTRDTGDTLMDSSKSCQLHWDKHWVPYIVVNIEELIRKISEHDDVKKIVIGRSYEVLGGNTLRVLPKELYFTDAGGAETALFIQKGARVNGEVEVNYMDKKDRQKFNLYYRVILRLISYI